ncbi:hypothetical protein Tco_0637447 [Tanacetum coccineum]
MMGDKYGYVKNHKKTVKNGQTWTRERNGVQEPEAKVKISQSKALISSLSSNAPLDLVKAQREWKFVLATHSEEAQGVLTRIATLAIRVSSDLI